MRKKSHKIRKMYTQYLCIERGGENLRLGQFHEKICKIIRPPVSMPNVISIVIVSFFFSKKWEIAIFEFLAVSQKILLFDTKSVI